MPSSHQPGERVGVLLSQGKDEVRFLGYGTYRGDRLVPDWESYVSLFAGFHRDPSRWSEELCRKDATWMANLTAQHERQEDATEEEVERQTQSLIAERKLVGEMGDEEFRGWVLARGSSFTHNPFIEMDNGDHWWGRRSGGVMRNGCAGCSIRRRPTAPGSSS